MEAFGAAALEAAALGAVVFGVADYCIGSCGEEEGIWVSFSQISMWSATSSVCFMNNHRNLNPGE